MVPHLIELRDPYQLTSEQFGPVLHVVRYRASEFEPLLAAIRRTGYGLTLGVQTRLESTWQRVVSGVRAGNVYRISAHSFGRGETRMAGKSVDARGAVRRAASGRQRNTSRPVFHREVDPSREAAVLHRLACELLGVCGMALMRFKANPGRRAVAALRNFSPKANYAGRMLDDANKLAVIHTRWQRKTGYFDQDGHPKVISVTGPAPSFEALCKDCGVHRERERLRKLACSFGMCAPAGSDRLAYLSEITLVTGIPSLMLARAVITVERFLKTCAFNGKPGRKVSESMADRTAVVTLSDAQFREFAQAMRGILHDFIESSDRRLSAQAARDATLLKPALRSRPTGVTAFVFRE